MGYDIHLLRFVDGEPKARAANRVHELLSLAADAAPDEHGYARVSWEGGEADVYGVTRSANESIDSVVEPDHAEHLPAELKGRPRYAIDSGTALADVIRRL